MSAIVGGIGPVSVRYAAQIRELLFAQAVQRLVAEEQAARATARAEETARREAVRTTRVDDVEPVRVDIESDLPAPNAAEASPASAAPASPAPAQIVDIQA